MQPFDKTTHSSNRSESNISDRFLPHLSRSQSYDSSARSHYQQQHQRGQEYHQHYQRPSQIRSHSVVLPPLTHLSGHSWSRPESSSQLVHYPRTTSSSSSSTSAHATTTTSQPEITTGSGQGQIVFTRQLWSRSMPNEPIDVPVSRHSAQLTSETSSSSALQLAETGVSRRTSSTPSSRSFNRPPTSPSAESQTPLTPEESPPFRSTRKRAASNVEEDERSFGSAELSPTHGRTNSGDSAAQVCICQPDPKIPRPRNAFILYRQHHQANVIAEHPGLANPEISKIIGEQWRNQPVDVKNEWKRLAEEEKVRHQQQYPSYRYQPKRNTRRNSLTDTPGSAGGERAKCPKCGGRTTLAPAAYGNYTSLNTSPPMAATSSLPPQTPTSSTTPTSRTLPVLRELTLQSPASRRMGRPMPSAEMSPRRVDDRDEALISPDSKRRRFNTEQPVTMYRAMPPRYSITSPVSPYIIGQAPHPHPYPPAQIASGHARRESLPSLRMMSPPGPMAPPPRPGMGYQQHRLAQGHTGPDRSLTLPPLQTGNARLVTPPPKTADSKSAQDVMISLSLSEKLEVVRRIAPPAALDREKARGPLIAIEGDSPEAVQNLAKWLLETLGKEEEMDVQLADSPDVREKEKNTSAMAQYHLLAAEWLNKSKSLSQALSYTVTEKPLVASPSETATTRADDGKAAQDTSKSSSDVASDRDSRMSIDSEQRPQEEEQRGTETGPSEKPASSDTTEQQQRQQQTVTISAPAQVEKSAKKPVLIIPLFSLHATNIFSCRIPITDVYSPKEHWQWSATLWRGIIGPDLTIYLRDVEGPDVGRPVEHSEIERLFVVKRRKSEDNIDMDIESATLRRVGFEVSEWIRAHGASRKA